MLFSCKTLCPAWASLLAFLCCTCGCSTESSVDEPQEIDIPGEVIPDGYLFYRDDDTGHLKYIAFMGNITDPGFSLLDSQAVDMDLGLNCYHPEVSPDGKWVAFSTSYEPAGESSKLYVKRIGSSVAPLKLNVPNAATPRWRILPNGDTVIVYVDATLVLPSKNMENYESEFQSRFSKWEKSGTWMVPFREGAFGEAKKITDGTFSGGVTEDMTFMVNALGLFMGRHITYNDDGSIKSTEDSVWYDRDQTCNASLSRDGTNRTLFLDMSGAQGVEFAGEKYRPHQRILVVDEFGNLVDAVPSPAGTAFDHTEWVGVDDYVVASLQNSDLLHDKIVLVNMQDSSIVDLVHGGELWHPNLWVKQNP